MEERFDVVRVGRGMEGEVVRGPIRISVGVDLPKEEDWFFVNFDCWGQSCGTLFLTLEEALRWCVVCFDKNLNRANTIKDKEGRVLYDEEAISRYCMERT